jgi:hypothetical protein
MKYYQYTEHLEMENAFMDSFIIISHIQKIRAFCVGQTLENMTYFYN